MANKGQQYFCNILQGIMERSDIPQDMGGGGGLLHV